VISIFCLWFLLIQRMGETFSTRGLSVPLAVIAGLFLCLILFYIFHVICGWKWKESKTYNLLRKLDPWLVLLMSIVVMNLFSNRGVNKEFLIVTLLLYPGISLLSGGNIRNLTTKGDV